MRPRRRSGEFVSQSVVFRLDLRLACASAPHRTLRAHTRRRVVNR